MYISSFDTRRAVETEDEVTEEVVRTTVKNCDTDGHDWSYLTEKDRKDWQKCILPGGWPGIAVTRPVPDARCTRCTKVLMGGVEGYYSPHGLYARPYNGN